MSRRDRVYRSDDRDMEDNDLCVSQGGNGDWYLTIKERVAGIVMHTTSVRVTTSGAPREQPYVGLAMAYLYDALGGEHPLKSSFFGDAFTAMEAAVDKAQRIIDPMTVEQVKRAHGELKEAWERFKLGQRLTETNVVRRGVAIVNGARTNVDMGELPEPVPRSREEAEAIEAELTKVLSAQMTGSERIDTPSLLTAEKGARWMTVVFREGQQLPTTIGLFSEQDDAEKHYTTAGAQWSDSYLCQVVRGPNDGHDPETCHGCANEALAPLTPEEDREAYNFGKATGIGYAAGKEAIAESKARKAKR